jgi:hypothetical protein
MKISDWTSLNLASEIVEDFEEMENESKFHDVPDDFDEKNNKEEEVLDDNRFVDSIDDIELIGKWEWYTKTVPPHVSKILKWLKSSDSCFNLGIADRMLRDVYAKCIYESYINPGHPDVAIDKAIDGYMEVIESAPTSTKWKMLSYNLEDLNDTRQFYGDFEMMTVSFLVTRGVTNPLHELFGWDLEALDSYFSRTLYDRIHEVSYEEDDPFFSSKPSFSEEGKVYGNRKGSKVKDNKELSQGDEDNIHRIWNLITDNLYPYGLIIFFIFLSQCG